MQKISGLLKLQGLFTLLLLLLAPFSQAAVPLGAVMTDFGNYDLATANAIQADGKIVVVGETYGSSGYDAALARYLPDGRLDTAYSPAGVQLHRSHLPEAHRVLASQARE